MVSYLKIWFSFLAYFNFPSSQKKMRSCVYAQSIHFFFLLSRWLKKEERVAARDWLFVLEDSCNLFFLANSVSIYTHLQVRHVPLLYICICLNYTIFHHTHTLTSAFSYKLLCDTHTQTHTVIFRRYSAYEINSRPLCLMLFQTNI